MQSIFSWSSLANSVQSLIQDNEPSSPVFVCQCQRPACHKIMIRQIEKEVMMSSLISVMTLNLKVLHSFSITSLGISKNHREIHFRNVGGELTPQGQSQKGFESPTTTTTTTKGSCQRKGSHSKMIASWDPEGNMQCL